MKYTQIAPDAFQKLQLNAGMLLTAFDPENGSLSNDDIFAATGGGVSFTATPTYIDFGEDIDNVPSNTMELKQLDYVEAKLSGTGKTVDKPFAKALIAAADVSGDKVTPRSTLAISDFQDIWWVGDYSDVTTGAGAGFIAIRLINALSTGGFQVQSNDKGKGDFSFEFTGHYSLEDIDKVPYELYIKDGESSDVTLSALTIGNLTLDPTFDPSVTEYAAATSNATNVVTATASDSSSSIAITVNGSTIENGAAATWQSGENTVVVSVSSVDSAMTYTVTVTKSA